MNIKIELRRSVKIECYRILGTVSHAQKRDELHAILQLTQQQQGIVNVEDVNEHLLKGIPEIVSKRMLYICEKYKLLEREQSQYVLTKYGTEALDRKQIFIPEYGSWKIWVTNDPLVPSILKIEPVRTNYRGNSREGENPINLIPDWINELKGQVALTSSDNKAAKFDDCERKAELHVSDAQIEIIWTLNSNEKCYLQLQGQFGEKYIDNPLTPPERSFEETWELLLLQNDLLSDWNIKRNHFRVSFDELNDLQKNTGNKNLKLDNCNIDRYGKFFSTTVDNANIYPRSSEDAHKWALWRLKSSIHDYVLEEDYESKLQDANEPFSEFDIDLPDRNQLAKSIRDNSIKLNNPPSPSFWYLQAPLDWEL